jgi:hypothetical protein
MTIRPKMKSPLNTYGRGLPRHPCSWRRCTPRTVPGQRTRAQRSRERVKARAFWWGQSWLQEEVERPQEHEEPAPEALADESSTRRYIFESVPQWPPGLTPTWAQRLEDDAFYQPAGGDVWHGPPAPQHVRRGWSAQEEKRDKESFEKDVLGQSREGGLVGQPSELHGSASRTTVAHHSGRGDGLSGAPLPSCESRADHCGKKPPTSRATPAVRTVECAPPPCSAVLREELGPERRRQANSQDSSGTWPHRLAIARCSFRGHADSPGYSSANRVCTGSLRAIGFGRAVQTA